MNKSYIFHHDDLDGITGGLIANKFIEEAILVSVNYEKKINPLDIIDDNDAVIIVDYSFEPEIMQRIYEMIGNKFTWIDHHVSAIKKSQRFDYKNARGIRDLNFCGAELSYMYYVNSYLPKLLIEIGNFDMFRNFGTEDFKESLKIMYGCMSNQEVLKRAIGIMVNNESTDSFYEFFEMAGNFILKYKKIEYKEDCGKYAYVRNIWNKRVLCMNTTEGGLGLQLIKAYDPKKHDMILTYNYNGSGWCYGFYTDKKAHPEINCAEIAEKFGGGGHKAAAGAETDYLIKELIEE